MAKKATPTPKSKPHKATKAGARAPIKRPTGSRTRVPLTPEELEAIGAEALGGRGWKRAFVRGTGIAGSSLTRYLRGVYPIPQWIAVLLEVLVTLRRAGLPAPVDFSLVPLDHELRD